MSHPPNCKFPKIYFSHCVDPHYPPVPYYNGPPFHGYAGSREYAPPPNYRGQQNNWSREYYGPPARFPNGPPPFPSGPPFPNGPPPFPNGPQYPGYSERPSRTLSEAQSSAPSSAPIPPLREPSNPEPSNLEPSNPEPPSPKPSSPKPSNPKPSSSSHKTDKPQESHILQGRPDIRHSLSLILSSNPRKADNKPPNEESTQVELESNNLLKLAHVATDYQG
jgi:hypothetical protein